MAKQKKMQVFHQNPFYDDVFGTFDVVVPSKRLRYKQNERKEITEIIAPRGTQEFEKNIRRGFSNGFKPEWPRKGRLLIAMWIAIKESDYRNKDIDNITKSILDALKGIAYIDDVQIDTIHVQKFPSDHYGFMIGIKSLDKEDPGWYFPPLYAQTPFKKKQTYTFITKQDTDAAGASKPIVSQEKPGLNTNHLTGVQ